ncbi:carboxypeptidase B-like isoform X2 [Lineus longissimus]|uniref:carboxypeptidase B-like isoform X2 n=1 Tax=Lineus longissimus TaxID=88925 RepID=UPI00315D342D
MQVNLIKYRATMINSYFCSKMAWTESISFCLLIFLVLFSGASCRASYHGDKVIRVTPATEDQLLFLQDMYANGNDKIVDFWTDPVGLGFEVDMRITRCIDDQDGRNRRKRMQEEEFSFSTYHTYDEIMDWTRSRSEACPPELNCSIEVIGKSYEGRDIIVLKLGVPGRNKTGLFFDCGMHSREWISPATCLYLINAYIEGYRQNDGPIIDMLTTWDIHVIPIVNPDGYNYTWTVNRLWRKTRTPNIGSDCVGTDPNRNWDFHWRAKEDPCQIIYPGPYPFSEPCVQAVADYLLDRTNVLVYINVHSFGQMWLPSWGYTHELPRDFDDLERVAQRAARASRIIFGSEYRVATSGQLLVSNRGVAKDWMKGVAGVKYTYTLELRDRGQYGFLLPEDQIIPTGIEIFYAFEALLNEVEEIEHINA